eukprot:TRINITY_DN5987_c1_g2_i1.p1 TRINITY_DN5987_c1_g2~~TRINITY_DN5987_c1_g2_i1.p1  ORF type:complete len:287 (-),score=40.18 TRINITY_DN5987_c1_g2_i1:247-1107(-)
MSRPFYHSLEVIDRGAQATVYKAIMDDGDGVNNGQQYVAVKIFKKRDAQAKMLSELRCLTAVQGHPNIVRIIDHFEQNNRTHAIVLEFCGEDLRKSASHQPFMQERAVEMMRGVLCALVHVHELNIVHRDVKPDNIAIAQDGCPRLLDFGIATVLTDEDEMRKFCGTVGFAAPELHKKMAYGLPVDVYGLGATFYLILSGGLAFATPGITQKELIENTIQSVVSFDGEFDHVSDHVKETIKWLMHTQASKRPSASRALLWPPFGSGFAHVGHPDEHDHHPAEVPDQ